MIQRQTYFDWNIQKCYRDDFNFGGKVVSIFPVWNFVYNLTSRGPWSRSLKAAFNLAMLAKQGWRLNSNPNSLVAQIYKTRYYPHGDIFHTKLGSSPSYTWRSILNGLEVVKRDTRWRVGNGEKILIWEDKWLPTPTTYKVISPPPPPEVF